MATTRRRFVSAVSAGALCAAAPLSLAAPPRWDKTVKVAVVGGGIAGLTAALAARESGADKVLILEKGSFLGGHALISGGGFVACGTAIQKDAGITDSAEADWQDAVSRGLAQNGFLQRDPAVAKMVFDQQTAALEWLQKQGVKFEDKPGYAYGNTKRVHYFAPRGRQGNAAAIEALTEAARRAGVEILTETRLTGLLTAGPELGSPVEGLTAVGPDGATIRVRATGGVVLACGGYVSNPELMRRYHPYLEGVTVLGSPLVTGDGMLAAAALGAGVVVTHNELGATMSNVEATGKKIRPGAFAVSNLPLIMVKKDGARFNDETIGGRYTTPKMVLEKIPVAYWIIDGKSAKEAREVYFKSLLVQPGLLREYDSLDSLARGEGIDAAGLRKTVERYNRDVDAGQDSEFGRVKLLQKIDTPPFIVFAGAPCVLYTYSGLDIDTSTRVLNTLHQPVPGLYAAGDTAGRLDAILGLGQGGVSGLSVATVTGLIAGRQAAKR